MANNAKAGVKGVTSWPAKVVAWLARCVGLAMFLVLLSLLLICGCVVLFSHTSHRRSCGQLELAQQFAVLETTITIPKSDVPSLSLRIDDGRGNERAFSGNPDWPLVLKVEIEDKNGNPIISRLFDRSTMVFTNGYVPATGVAFDIGSHFLDALEQEKEYILRVTVQTPCEELGTGEIMLGWVKQALAGRIIEHILPYDLLF